MKIKSNASKNVTYRMTPVKWNINNITRTLYTLLFAEGDGWNDEIVVRVVFSEEERAEIYNNAYRRT